MRDDGDTLDMTDILAAIVSEAISSTVSGGRRTLRAIAESDVLTLSGRNQLREWRTDLLWLWAPAQEGFAFSAVEIADALESDVKFLQSIVLEQVGISREDVLTLIYDEAAGVARLRKRLRGSVSPQDRPAQQSQEFRLRRRRRGQVAAQA